MSSIFTVVLSVSVFLFAWIITPDIDPRRIGGFPVLFVYMAIGFFSVGLFGISSFLIGKIQNNSKLIQVGPVGVLAMCVAVFCYLMFVMFPSPEAFVLK